MKKMKKNRAMDGVSVALILAAVLTGLAACQNGLTAENEYLPLPPTVPYADILEDGDGIYKYALEWKHEPDVLRQDGAYDAVSAERMEQAFETWQLYAGMIDPRPFHDKDGTEIAPDSNSNPEAFECGVNIAGDMKLDNLDSDAGNIVIHRYWPADISTVADWRAAEAAREAAFEQAVAEIEAMMAAIKKSPLYTDSNPLAALHGAMKRLIPPENYAPSPPAVFTYDNNVVVPDPRGALYEYYLGYAPISGDYAKPGGPFALPGTKAL